MLSKTIKIQKNFTILDYLLLQSKLFQSFLAQYNRNHLLLLMVSVSQIFGSGLEQFWLRVVHEVIDKCLLELWSYHLKAWSEFRDSLLMSLDHQADLAWCWLLVAGLGSCPHGSLHTGWLQTLPAPFIFLIDWLIPDCLIFLMFPPEWIIWELGRNCSELLW